MLDKSDRSVEYVDRFLSQNYGGLTMLETILMVFALVFFCCAAANVPYPRVSFGWLGLAFWVLAILFGGVGVGGHLGR